MVGVIKLLIRAYYSGKGHLNLAPLQTGAPARQQHMLGKPTLSKGVLVMMILES